MLEFTRKELKFKLDGNEYLLKFPSVKQISEYSVSYEKAEDKFDCIVEFLNRLGLSREVSEGMELDHLTTILKALTEEKK